jgi:hypothetical protein
MGRSVADLDGGAAGGAAPPEYWTISRGGDGTTLTYAVRGGGKWLAVALLGAALVLGCALALWRFVSEGDLASAGVVLLLLPAGGIVAGAHCLDITLRARTSYLLGPEKLTARRIALFGKKTLEIPRSAVTGISQRYSPPGKSSPSGAEGDWVTAVQYRAGAAPATELVLDGMTTPEEARWLGPLLGAWAGVGSERGFAGGFEEADPSELPEL